VGADLESYNIVEKAFSVILEFYSSLISNPKEVLEQHLFIKMQDGKTRDDAIKQLFRDLAPLMAVKALKNLSVIVTTDLKVGKKVAEKGFSDEFNAILLRSDECSVFPHCYSIPEGNKCLRVQAARRLCSNCSSRISSEKEATSIAQKLDWIKGERKRKHRDFLKSEIWRKVVVPRVLEYDKYRCVICGKGRPSRLLVHHIRRDSGDEDLSLKNLVTLCHKCHQMLHGLNLGTTDLFAAERKNLEWEIDLDDLESFYEKVRNCDERIYS